MRIGKYVTNPGVIGAAFGAVSTAKQTRSMPNDWRRYLVWGIWIASFALAIASVAKAEEDHEYEVERKHG